MSSDPNKRQIPVSYAGGTRPDRLSDPVPVHSSRAADAEPTPAEQRPESGAIATPTVGDIHVTAMAAHSAATPFAPPTAATAATVVEASAPVLPAAEASAPPETSNVGIGDRHEAGQAPSADGRSVAPGKAKPDIETLEQFIAYAYGRKGQRVVLKPKTERLIAQNPRLDDGALSRLQALVDSDALLAVPRQVLLVSREVEGLPALRAALQTFVRDVMLRHPVFSDPGMRATLRNLPEAPPVADALLALAAYEPPPNDGKDPLKPAELQTLRQNAAHLLAVWLANSRSLNAEELSALLFQTLWAPAARGLADDNARLRALTEVEQPAGVGLACDRFRQRAIEARAAQDQALREAGALRGQVADLDTRLAEAETARDTASAELHALRESTAAELAAMRRQQDAERVRLTHELEQLRGRLVRRLGDSVEMLEVGLTALRNKTPRTEVMAERAEHVIDALRAEASNLREE